MPDDFHCWMRGWYKAPFSGLACLTCSALQTGTKRTFIEEGERIFLTGHEGDVYCVKHAPADATVGTLSDEAKSKLDRTDYKEARMAKTTVTDAFDAARDELHDRLQDLAALRPMLDSDDEAMAPFLDAWQVALTMAKEAATRYHQAADAYRDALSKQL